MDAINLLAASIPNAFGAPAAALQPGQVIQALVLELLESGAFRLQLPQAVVDVKTSVPLTPGSTVTLAVKGSGPRLDILAQSEPGQPSVVAPEAAARPPIGEAVVISRTALADAKPVAALPREAAQQPAPSTPLAALGEAVRSAATRQGGLAPLFADLEQALQNPAVPLPQPVRAAAAQLLALPLTLDAGITADGVKQALARSGVLMEAQLAAGASAPAAPPAAVSPETGGDLKSALLVLRQALKTWAVSAGASPAGTADPGLTLGKIEPLTLARPEALGLLDSLEIADPAVPSAATPLSARDAEDIAKQLSALLAKAATPAPAAAANTLAPPYRGAPLTPQPPALPAASDGAAPREVASRLLAETDAALARSTLLQAASLPDAPSPRGESGPRWSFEVPFAMPQGTGIVPFEISRDGRGTSAGEPRAAAWRARFSIDLEPIGPVHALVALTGDRVSVTLCAERLTTASQLNDGAPMLNEALRAAELQPSDLTVRVGTPRTPDAAPPGRFMDRAS